MTSIQDVIGYLEGIAPPAYQEAYDNAGLLVGDATAGITGIVTCLDATEPVVAEAAAKGCNLIVAHHPILFKGLKRLTGSDYVQRTLLRAVRQDVAIYAIHTNLDNVFHRGVNERIAQRLGLKKMRLLAPKSVRKKVELSIPRPEAAAFLDRLSRIEGAELTERDSVNEQVRLEGTADAAVIPLLSRLAPAHGLITHAIDEPSTHIGSGMVGELARPMEETHFLNFLKERMQTPVIRHSPLLGQMVKQVALCGGSGIFLLPQAKREGAQVFITGDVKYHEFFDAEEQMLIADIGHYESEQFTIQLLQELLSEKFRNFAVHLTEVRTNPVRYLF